MSGPNEVDFDATQVGWPDRTIYFEDKSSVPVGESYWEFGDGITSYDKNILHTYWNAGTYPVTHTINNNDEITKNVLVRNLEIPNADFIYTIDPPPPERAGDVTVHFFDQSEGIIKTWQWDFGNGIQPSNDQNPVVDLEMFTDYDISLTTTNAAGVSESIKHFYYDPAKTPQVLIIPWQDLSFYYNIDVSISKLQPPFTYEIDFGDGTSQTITSSLNWETFNHQYFNWGDYLITAHVTGTNDQGIPETVFSAEEITVRGWDLDVQISYSAPTSPPYPGCQETIFTANVSGGGSGVTYMGTWYLYKIGAPGISHTQGNALEVEPMIYSFPEEGFYKIGFDATSDYGGSGHGEIVVKVENAPQFIDAGIYPLGPMQLGLGSQQTFECTNWPIGSPGIPESQWHTTNLRWTLTDPDGELVMPDFDEPPEDIFPWQESSFVHQRTYTFTKETTETDTYTLMLEAWNGTHNYEQDGFLDPMCVNTLPFYDYAIKTEIIVSDDLPYLKVTQPGEGDNYEYKFDANAHPDQTINLTNPGSQNMHWSSEKYIAYGETGFFDITGQFQQTINSGETGDITFDVYENSDDGDKNGAIKITGLNSNDDEVQGSPAYVYLDQEDNMGPTFQFVYNSSPVEHQNFGSAVAIYDNYAVIGALEDNEQSGKAFVAKRNDVGIWNVVATLEASDGYIDKFGRSVDIHGEYIIVGANLKAYIFKRPASGWSGTINEIVTSVNSGGGYGYKASIWGDYAAVSGYESNYVKILYRNQWGNVDGWGLHKTLSGNSGSDFGYNIDLDNDLLAIGVPKADGGKGEIHIYNRNLNQSNDWGLEQSFQTNSSAPDDAFLGGKGFDLTDNKLFYSHRINPCTNNPGVPCIEGYLVERDNSGNWLVANIFSTWESSFQFNEVENFKLFGGKCGAIMPGANLSSGFTGLFSRPYDMYSYWFGVVGGTVSQSNQPLDTWAPSEANGWGEPWNGNSNFGYSLETDFNSVVTGGPNKNNEGINDCGAVYIFDDRTRSLCAAQIELDFVNFKKPAGNYPDVRAYKLSLGGNGYNAIIKDGANITYQAEEIILDDGFLAEDGAEFIAEATNCSELPDQLLLPENYEAIGENSFAGGNMLMQNEINFQDMMVVRMRDIRRQLLYSHPAYPWHQVNFYEDVDKIEIIDEHYSVLSKIENPNTIICFFDKAVLPEKYDIIVHIGEKKFSVSAFRALSKQKNIHTVEQSLPK